MIPLTLTLSPKLRPGKPAGERESLFTLTFPLLAGEGIKGKGMRVLF